MPGSIRRCVVYLVLAGCGQSHAPKKTTPPSSTSPDSGATPGPSGTQPADARPGPTTPPPMADAAGPGTPPASQDARPASADASTPPMNGADASPAATKLEAVPPELIWSAAKGRSASSPVTVRNGTTASVSLTALTIMGADAAGFAPMPMPMLPLAVGAGMESKLPIAFSPPGNAPSKPNHATLQIAAGAAGALTVQLWALPTPATDGGNEPTLKAIVDTLGYAIDVGGDSLSLGLGAAPIGSEVKAQLLVRAAAGPVTMIAAARFAPDEPLPYGWYTNPAPTLNQVASMQKGTNVTLFPALEAGAKTTFDPGDMPFGLYVKSNVHTTYSEDARNAMNPTKHAVRVYPLKDRMGAPIADGYLACFEEASNGDYNDYVFVMRNVKPAP